MEEREVHWGQLSGIIFVPGARASRGRAVVQLSRALPGPREVGCPQSYPTLGPVEGETLSSSLGFGLVILFS